MLLLLLLLLQGPEVAALVNVVTSKLGECGQTPHLTPQQQQQQQQQGLPRWGVCSRACFHAAAARHQAGMQTPT
jgi:hypothetical protein